MTAEERFKVQQSMMLSVRLYVFPIMQGCLKGYSFRQKVVHEVRRQYEEIVSQLQPLAEESVNWPSKGALCYPRFTPSTFQGDHDWMEGPIESESGLCVDELAPSNEAILKDVTPSRIRGEHNIGGGSGNSGLTSVEGMVKDELKGGDLSVPDEDATKDKQKGSADHEDAIKDVQRDSTDLKADEAGEMDSDVFKSLHKDRDSLLELRSKLGMELLWLKQAIASRQKVIKKGGGGNPYYYFTHIIVILQYIQLKKELELPSPK